MRIVFKQTRANLVSVVVKILNFFPLMSSKVDPKHCSVQFNLIFFLVFTTISLQICREDKILSVAATPAAGCVIFAFSRGVQTRLGLLLYLESDLELVRPRTEQQPPSTHNDYRTEFHWTRVS